MFPLNPAYQICSNHSNYHYREEFAMNMKARRALDSLSESIQRNTAPIEEALRNAGVNPDAALVYSAAKYFEALNKLATE
jgi:hypothetical protein